MIFLRVFFILILFFQVGAHAEEMPLVPEGPLLLTSVRHEQLAADYWADRMPNPDLPLKTPEELKKFNEEIVTMVAQRVDVFAIEKTKEPDQIRRWLNFELDTIKGRILFGVNKKRVAKQFFDRTLKPAINFSEMTRDDEVRWGAVTRGTSVRALPTHAKMLEAPHDIEFDQLQYTLIKMWTPVAIFHESKDGKWFYIQAPYVRGWVEAKDIAIFKSREELKSLSNQKKFLVVTGKEITIFFDDALSQIGEEVTMGAVLPLYEAGENAYTIWFPLRRANGEVLLRAAFIPIESDVSVGYLPLTQRNIFNQAFKLLGARYGWGGMYKGRDCSGFTHDVFLSLGVDMPRDSKQQAYIGTQLGHFELKQGREEKLKALHAGLPGLTLLRMSLHLMLYLGEENGQHYVIHSTWAERVSMTNDEKRRINQVVVSDLTLNGNSYRGPLFDRVLSINELN
jgi:hypothetical protein